MKLALYHTVPTFNNPKIETFWKTYWEKEKMLVTSIFSFFPKIFSTPPKTNFNFNFLAKLNLSSANTFNWDQSKISCLFTNGYEWLQVNYLCCFVSINWAQVSDGVYSSVKEPSSNSFVYDTPKELQLIDFSDTNGANMYDNSKGKLLTFESLPKVKF